MRPFRRQVSREAMVERARNLRVQAERRRGADEPVEDDRHAVMARPGDGARHRGDLAAAERGEHVEAIAARIGGETGGDGRVLPREASVVHARPASGPALSPEERGGDGRGGGRVADPHFPGHEKVRRRIDRSPAGRERRAHLGVRHGGAPGEIRRRAVEVERVDLHPGPGEIGEPVDRRPARLEVADHLRRHLGREGTDALRRDAVVAGEDQHLRRVERGPRIANPARIPDRQLLQPAERARRLGQLPVTCLGRVPRGRIGAGQVGHRGAEIGEGREVGHGRSVVRGPAPSLPASAAAICDGASLHQPGAT